MEPTPATPLSVDVQTVLSAYASEVAAAIQRAVVAEATSQAYAQRLAQVEAELAEARTTIQALSPGAPDLPEGD
jgi:hypothetical protein